MKPHLEKMLEVRVWKWSVSYYWEATVGKEERKVLGVKLGAKCG